MATQETTKSNRPTFTPEQHEAWKKARLLLKSLMRVDSFRYRTLHVAMSELRAIYKKHKGPIETRAKNPNKAKQRELTDKYAQFRQRVDAWKAYLDNPGSKKLYIITDVELSDSQRAVQSAHCAALFQKEHPNAPWSNGILVLLKPKLNHYMFKDIKPNTGEVMNKLAAYFRHSWNYKSIWREEDRDNQITSIALLNDYIELGHVPFLEML